MADVGEVLAHFMERVDVSEGCWLWTGGLTSNGYGGYKPRRSFDLGRSQVGAHVMSWRLAHGLRAVGAGKEVRHRCDVRHCVRPDHLVRGTRQQNMQDCIKRGRLRPGSGVWHANAAFSQEQLEMARSLYERRALTQRELAVLMHLTSKTVSNMLTERTYKAVS